MKSAIQAIKLLLSDVDGVLTDGRLYYTHKGECMKVFHVLDGYAIKALQEKNIAFGIITARSSYILQTRMKELGVEIIYQNAQNKLAICQHICLNLNLCLDEVAYIGDDIPDLELLKQAGFSATVPHAPKILKEQCDYCTRTPAGMGALREFCDLILQYV